MNLRISDIEKSFSKKYFNFSELDAIEWYKQGIKDNTIELSNKYNLDLGKLYILRYDSDIKDNKNLHMSLILDVVVKNNKRIYLGLNLNLFPLDVRLFFVKFIRVLYFNDYKNATNVNKESANKQSFVKLDLNKLQKSLGKFGFSNGLRLYQQDIINKNIRCVNYNEWKNAIRLNLPHKYTNYSNDKFDVIKNYLKLLKNSNDI